MEWGGGDDYLLMKILKHSITSWWFVHSFPAATFIRPSLEDNGSTGLHRDYKLLSTALNIHHKSANLAVLVTLVRATPKADPQRGQWGWGHSFIPTQILWVSEKPNFSASTLPPMMTSLLIPARDMPPPHCHTVSIRGCYSTSTSQSPPSVIWDWRWRPEIGHVQAVHLDIPVILQTRLSPGGTTSSTRASSNNSTTESDVWRCHRRYGYLAVPNNSTLLLMTQMFVPHKWAIFKRENNFPMIWHLLPRYSYTKWWLAG